MLRKLLIFIAVATSWSVDGSGGGTAVTPTPRSRCQSSVEADPGLMLRSPRSTLASGHSVAATERVAYIALGHAVIVMGCAGTLRRAGEGERADDGQGAKPDSDDPSAAAHFLAPPSAAVHAMTCSTELESAPPG